jgi:hypothetical protein
LIHAFYLLNQIYKLLFHRNGVVKFECVMQLREQLDQLGSMKGITQDEKGKRSVGEGGWNYG